MNAGSDGASNDEVRQATTILLTEDDVAVRRLARRALERSGYDVLEAETSEQAIALSTDRPTRIDLLVTDVVMPGLSGRALAERLKPDRPEMKVLYTSGYTDDAIVRHGVLEPGFAFLQKPYTPDRLVAKVQEVLDQQASA